MRRLAFVQRISCAEVSGFRTRNGARKSALPKLTIQPPAQHARAWNLDYEGLATMN